MVVHGRARWGSAVMDRRVRLRQCTVRSGGQGMMMTGSARWDMLCHGGQGLAEHGSVRHGVLWRFRFGVSR
jgi:hypothetical protein